MSIKNQLKIYIIALIFIPIFSISILPIHQHFSSHTRVLAKDFNFHNTRTSKRQNLAGTRTLDFYKKH